MLGQAQVLQEGVSHTRHQHVPVQPCPGTPLDVAETEFLLELLMGLLADPAWSCVALVESGLADGLPLELSGADEAQRRVAPEWIVEPVDVAGQGLARLGPGLKHGAPHEDASET
jgi:hypothetical protein